MYKRVIKEPNASSVVTGGEEEAIDLGTSVFVDWGRRAEELLSGGFHLVCEIKKKGGVIHEELGLGERCGKFVKGLTYSARRGRVVFLCGIHAAMRFSSSTHQM